MLLGPPAGGASTGLPATAVPVNVSIAGLAAGVYTATITITGAPPTANSPQYVFVTLVVLPPPFGAGGPGDRGGGGGGGCFVTNVNGDTPVCEREGSWWWFGAFLVTGLMLVAAALWRSKNSRLPL